MGSLAATTATGSSDVTNTAFDSTTNAMVLNNPLIGNSTDGSASAKATAINLLTGTTGVTATAGTTTGASGGAAYSATTGQGITLTVNGTAIVLLEGGAAGSTQADDQATTISTINTALTAASSTVVAVADGAGIKLTDTTGANIVTSEGTAVASGNAADFGLGTLGTATAKLTLSSTSSQGIQVSAAVDGVSASNAVSGFTGSEFATAQTTTLATAVSAINIGTAAGATLGIAAIDGALDTINSTRATLGSYQSRFDSIVASSLTTSENLSASRSRIMDADFAQETAQLTKSQILQQSGIAMLAQANSIPQNVLALLQ
jgi:flagellin